ncbi:YchJ family protein [Ketobacter alkanivorans]|uniref:UPF0225 protein Kalk_03900 n=1 Tax=Ketobacter alkanivorans TaxID=1917421 RepID=A0A2K9LH76_9GAMM|nr:YchJ family protein [Ketobacter alkanivorans]AUM11613.1 hypothetical protein Kalk_03900 [Ketobacter alkanivorans]MCP5015309.1 YchJ family protein [Ketobacter sp.]
MTELCPCGSGDSYQQCCGSYHQGNATPTTAEQLMRSRYSAFARKLPVYLLETLHPSKRAPDELAKLEQSVAQGRWLGLKIISCRDGLADQDTGYVAFKASHEDASQQTVLEENSRFIKENNRWYYVDGVLAPHKPPGRNDACWCGSGKKYKKCHG